jgi:hypothetical protein
MYRPMLSETDCNGYCTDAAVIMMPRHQWRFTKQSSVMARDSGSIGLHQIKSTADASVYGRAHPELKLSTTLIAHQARTSLKQLLRASAREQPEDCHAGKGEVRSGQYSTVVECGTFLWTQCQSGARRGRFPAVALRLHGMHPSGGTQGPSLGEPAAESRCQRALAT